MPLYEELLEALGLPLVGEVSRIRVRRMARDALRIVGARILVIDEIHALLVGGDRQQPQAAASHPGGHPGWMAPWACWLMP